MLKRSMILGSYVYSYPETLAVSGFQKNLKNFAQHLRIIFKPLPLDDPKQRRPDITLAREKLGWEPRIGLEEGLEKTIKYFKSLLSMS